MKPKPQKRISVKCKGKRAFAISEIILTITTASTVVATALTALTVYFSLTDEQAKIPSQNGPIAVLPADEITMDALLFHLELQEVTHEADLIYVIGGSRYQPGSESSADFTFTPPLTTSYLRTLSILNQITNSPDRAWSSYVITRLLQKNNLSNFSQSSEDLSIYHKRDFTILTLNSDRTVTSLVTHKVTPKNEWIVIDAVIYKPNGNAWAESTSYHCAISKSEYDAKENLLSFGATHYWIHHDRLDPTALSSSEQSLWNRYEEGFCRVEFVDNMWNLAIHPPNTPLTSKFTYFLPVVK